jgi:hypothetical protein
MSYLDCLDGCVRNSGGQLYSDQLAIWCRLLSVLPGNDYGVGGGV